MTMSDRQWMFLKDVTLLIQYADSKGYKLTGGELWRTDEQQAKYIKDGKSQVNRSRHQDRLAIDFNLFVNGEIQWSNNDDWRVLGSFWEGLREENKWGGNYKTLDDPFHFETV